MISKAELLMGRDQSYSGDYTDEISDNLNSLLTPMNAIRTAWGNPMTVDSGWRPPAINKADGGAPNSKHMIGLACDIADTTGELWTWVLNNLELLQSLNIYMEDRRWTPTWVHFQLGQPKSGHRIFIPNTSPAPAPSNWDGSYDHTYDS